MCLIKMEILNAFLQLTASYKLDKSLLPPKKIFGNQSESFIKKRQRELEIYLQTIILYLAQHIPSCLAYFLDFDKYVSSILALEVNS